MPRIQVKPDLEMYYLRDNFADPWEDQETVLLLHGGGESGGSWFGWVPHLARTFDVVRPDMRGFGRSTSMEPSHTLSIDELVDDLVQFLDKLGIPSCHVVGAKFGGTVAMHFAGTRPDKVKTLTIAGSPVTGRGMFDEQVPKWLAQIRDQGQLSWARSSMGARLGSSCSEKAREWWIQQLGSAPQWGIVGLLSVLHGIDVTDDLARIQAPTLVVTTKGSALGSVDEVRSWQTRIPRSELVVIEGNSYHVAATHSDQAAKATMAFLTRPS